MERLNREINAGLSDPRLAAQFAVLGRLIAEETRKWGEVIRAVGITLQ